jgi:putative transposase
MTEENYCYENAIAERVNEILKDEFYLDQTFANMAYAKNAAKNGINLYNKIIFIFTEYDISIISVNQI